VDDYRLWQKQEKVKGVNPMQYQLIVETIAEQNAVRLRLLNEHGVFQAANELNLADHRAALWEGVP